MKSSTVHVVALLRFTTLFYNQQGSSGIWSAERQHVSLLGYLIFLIQINQENGYCGFLFGLPVHGFLPCIGQPKQGLHLFAQHRLKLCLLLGHQGDLAPCCKGCDKKEPFCNTKKCKEESRISEKEI